MAWQDNRRKIGKPRRGLEWENGAITRPFPDSDSPPRAGISGDVMMFVSVRPTPMPKPWQNHAKMQTYHNIKLFLGNSLR